MMKYLGAITTLGETYPSYINFSEDDAGQVVVTGREERQADGSCGRDFRIAMPKVCLELMLEDIRKNLGG